MLRKIIDCNSDEQMAVRDIRNQLTVRNSMYTDHEITLDEHLAWLNSLKSDCQQIVFAVFVNGSIAGVVSINALDRRHKKSDWAFYLDEKSRGGLGAALEYNLLNFAFDSLQLEKLNCEVIETNPAVVKMHKKFGFVEEGFRRSNIDKAGLRIGVYFLGITKNEWLEKKQAIFDKYKAVINKFNIVMEYECLND